MSSTGACDFLGKMVCGAIISTACGFVLEKCYGEESSKKSTLINCIAGIALGAVAHNADPITFYGATTGVIAGKICALETRSNDLALYYMLSGGLLVGGGCHLSKYEIEIRERNDSLIARRDHLLAMKADIEQNLRLEKLITPG